MATGDPMPVAKELNAPLVVARQIRRSKLSVNYTAPSGEHHLAGIGRR
jgi:hypothetical protein